MNAIPSRRRRPTARTTAVLLAAGLGLAASPLLTGSPAAVAEEHQVLSWGSNEGGQLGNGSNTDRWTPGSVAGMNRSDITALAAGGAGSDNSFAIALRKDKQIDAWGHNASGQLGNGNRHSQIVPSTVTGLTDVTAIAAGASHALAVKDGQVWAWGDNRYGQLGNNLTDTSHTVPVAVQHSFPTVKQVGAGCDFSVALDDAGGVWTWGRNVHGQLGTGDTVSRSVPQKVEGLPVIAEIAVGCGHVIALATNNGTVKAWGYNVYGQLGNASTASSPTPVDVRGLTEIDSIAAGAFHNYAVKAGKTVLGWGNNGQGQMLEPDATTPADLTTTHRTTPVVIPGLESVTAIAAGHTHNLAVRDGSVIAWGSNGKGQLGNGTNMFSRAPVTVLPPERNIQKVVTSLLGHTSYAH
ncbi:RCC1 domain-containing protein [Streptomyces purpureus]|uniref:RCC1-like domain-containing protein n=1 Tax=Streptomyces purpureus TaxID=1951 RepID=A0A918GX62_9ACTN|nr:sialidase [Streptomyces purpureus]GGT18053.1 hypothetical protein GCM10014713_08570 [Streptomyces purpureus]